MKTPLAWRNVLHNRTRSVAALSGISFAIVLIFMQLGFYASAKRSATLIYDALDFDVMIVSPEYSFVARPGTFPRHRLEQSKAVSGIASVMPMWLGYGDWRSQETRFRWGTVLLGVNPAQPPFRSAELNARLSQLTEVDTALFDALSRPEYGHLAPGYRSELQDRRLKMIGDYVAGTGFVAGAAAIVSDRTFRRLQTGSSIDQLSFGLVKLQPGASDEAVKQHLNALLTPSAVAFTRDEFYAKEQSFWLNTKPIGIMFTSGLLVAVIVGAVILYQVLASEVQNRIKEYATLKALGYTDRFVYSVILQQASIFALLGFLPATLCAAIIYFLLRTQARLPVEMEWSRTSLVAGLTLVMCLSATALAVRKLRRADPADLF